MKRCNSEFQVYIERSSYRNNAHTTNVKLQRKAKAHHIRFTLLLYLYLMREGQFIKRNIDRWKAYEEPTDDPDETAKRFMYLVDDLSYAKTFYPFSNTVRYINGLAAKIFFSIYKNRKEKKDRISSFFAIELPLAIQRNHKTLLFSLLFFLL